MLQTSEISQIQRHVQGFAFKDLFLDLLGWDDFDGYPFPIEVDEHEYWLTPIAQKRGFAVFQCGPDPEGRIPTRDTRVQIERHLSKQYFQNFIIFVDEGQTRQSWIWRRSETGKPAAHRTHSLEPGHSGYHLAQRLQALAVAFHDEEDTTHSDISIRVGKAFDVEKVTKKFYDEFKKQRDTFHEFIENIPDENDRSWYSSLMLNRLMFIYFIQKQGHLDGDHDYLRNRLTHLQRNRGRDHFFSFYRHFLLRLFHEGLGKQPHDRPADLDALIGNVPYLNGGIFDIHKIEQDYADIHIPDRAFEKLFEFFDRYQWHLDDRPLRDDRQINPDVLGYIFEKYINQKEMGAYYTKEDITEYIGKNTILPWLLDSVRKDVRIAFEPNGFVWGLLQEQPDKYIYDAVRYGTEEEIPPEIARGIDDVSQREHWNIPAPESHALPTEIWREYIARRQRYEKLRKKLVAGEVTEINDLITYNLNIRQFTQDIVDSSVGPELTSAFWKALNRVTVLDPTCGSGAFLFAALNILEPLYRGCLVSMQDFVNDVDRDPDRYGSRKFSNFRDVLREMERHPNPRYFIFKSIIVNNLYGVDIMDEAVEICKLRLFLKLMSHVSEGQPIEPLPDIDFNIRAGNALVGFATAFEVETAIEGENKHGTQRKFDLGDHMREIRHRARDVASMLRDFRYMQTEKDLASEHFRKAKERLSENSRELGAELDRALASGAGIYPGISTPNQSDYESDFKEWRRLHKPFHWWSEFYDIVDAGGFDCVIGNPPYVSRSKVDYQPWCEPEERYKDLYAYVSARSADLSARNHIGLILPLSITFAVEYATLRRRIRSARGSSWYSSFDNIPAALFTGVSQRCTIWIQSPHISSVYAAPLRRWRAGYRKSLMQSIAYTDVGLVDTINFGIPKVASEDQSELVRSILEHTWNSNGSDEHAYCIYFSPTARNFISAGLTPPPLVDVNTLSPIENNRHHQLLLRSNQEIMQALAACSSNVGFWFWLVRGDGFDVTSWIIKSFLAGIFRLDEQHLEILGKVGHLLDARSAEAIAFKKNAGKYVGNYNYRRLLSLVRRADLVLLSGLNCSREQTIDVIEFVERTLAINAQAGEKGIPAEVREVAATILGSAAQSNEPELLSEIDRFIIDQTGFDAARMALTSREEEIQIIAI